MGEKRLVFTSAGDRHGLHPSVRDGAGFDLLIYFYGADASVLEQLQARGGRVVVRAGGKFPNLLHASRSDPDAFERYDAVFVVDDDLALTSDEIGTLFDLRQEHDLWIIQPSFDPRGKVSYSYSLPRVHTRLRFTNFVETNAPLFSAPKLREFLREFDGQLKGLLGTDWWYMSLLGEDERRRYAVSDEVIALNPEARGGMREIHRLESREDGWAGWGVVRDRYGLRQVNPVVSAGIPRPLGSWAPKVAWQVRVYLVVMVARPESRRRIRQGVVDLGRRMIRSLSQRRS